MVNETVFDITVKPTAAGKAARVSRRPMTAAWRVRSTVKTGAPGSASTLQVSQASTEVIRVRGSIPAGGGSILLIFQIPDPAAFGRTAFIEALERRGVSVAARATGPNPEALLPRSRSSPASQRVALRVSPVLSEYTRSFSR